SPILLIVFIIVSPIPFPVLVSDLVNDDFLQLHIEQMLFNIFLPFNAVTSVIFFDSVLSLHFTQYISIINTIFNFITLLCYKIIIFILPRFHNKIFSIRSQFISSVGFYNAISICVSGNVIIEDEFELQIYNS